MESALCKAISSGPRRLWPGTGAATYRLALQAIARDSAAYGDYPLRQKWIAQMQTYKVALLDTAIYSCSPVLQDYVATAAPTRIGRLSALEDTLYNGYDATAMLLAGPPPAAVSSSKETVKKYRFSIIMRIRKFR